MYSGGLVVVKCPNLPAKSDSPVAKCRSVSLKPQQELALRHVPGCHGVDWLNVKQELARNAGKGSFHVVPYFILKLLLLIYFIN